MIYPRQTELISRIKTAGLKSRDIALALGCRSNLVSQRLGGFLPLSTGDELKIIKLLETAEKTKLKQKGKI
jgi:hypothetical protein